jgi:hypothetical protein
LAKRYASTAGASSFEEEAPGDRDAVCISIRALLCAMKWVLARFITHFTGFDVPQITDATGCTCGKAGLCLHKVDFRRPKFPIFPHFEL